MTDLTRNTAMIYPEEFWAIYGRGAKVYDATGRQLLRVMACNPETGEVIRRRYLPPWFWFGGFLCRPDLFSPSYLFLGIRRLRISKSYHREVTSHGFYPAPLHVVPPQPDN